MGANYFASFCLKCCQKQNCFGIKNLISVHHREGSILANLNSRVPFKVILGKGLVLKQFKQGRFNSSVSQFKGSIESVR